MKTFEQMIANRNQKLDFRISKPNLNFTLLNVFKSVTLLK